MVVNFVSNDPLQRVLLATVGSVCSRVRDGGPRVPSRTTRVRRPVFLRLPPETRRAVL